MRRISKAGVFTLATLVAGTPLAAQDGKAVTGEWSMSHRWIQGAGSTDYGTVLADLDAPETYRICRARADTVGAQTRELRVFVDDAEVPAYSLDQGSCIIARGSKFHLKYAGPNVGITNLLFGNFERLEPQSLLQQSYRNISRWSMNWVRDETAHH